MAIYHLPTHDPVHQITIVPRGGAGGMTLSPPGRRSKLSLPERNVRANRLPFGRPRGRAAVPPGYLHGASNDIQRATTIAREMVQRYGMSEKLGTVAYSSDDEVFIGRDYEKSKAYSERIAGEIDEEVKA